MSSDDIPIALPLFAFHMLKDEITGLEWNETTKNLAACSFDGWIKVKFHSLVANWSPIGKGHKCMPLRITDDVIYRILLFFLP